MTDQQRLVLQEKAEIHLKKSLYVQQVSFTTVIPAVRGIGNPALCALSPSQGSPTGLLTHESCLMSTYSTFGGRYTALQERINPPHSDDIFPGETEW